MEDRKSEGGAPKVSRHKLVEKVKENFYANVNNRYIENKDLAVLKAAPSTKKPLPNKPLTGTFGRAGAQPNPKQMR